MGDACKELGIALLPGVSTGSEIMMAADDGFTFLKLFPATAVGGIPLLKAFSGPFSDIAFCPTGGVTVETAPQFLALPNVKVVGGSWADAGGRDEEWRLGADHGIGEAGVGDPTLSFLAVASRVRRGLAPPRIALRCAREPTTSIADEGRARPRRRRHPE